MKIMLYLVFFIASFNVSTFSQIKVLSDEPSNKYAKFPKQRKLGRIRLRCVYAYKGKDPKANGKAQNMNKKEILLIGDTCSLFLNYGWYQIDSVVNRSNRNRVTFDEAMKLTQKYHPGASGYVYKTKHILSESGRIYDSRYYYTEEIPCINWHVRDSTKTILGYKCQKAEGEYRGRIWTAWYATLLSCNNGPYKFAGLSGLILQLYSADGEHFYTAQNISTQSEEIKKDILNEVKISREQYFKTMMRYKTNSAEYFQQFSSAPINKRRHFFNPIDKDFDFLK